VLSLEGDGSEAPVSEAALKKARWLVSQLKYKNN
jgi:hypothetical protein